MDVTDFLSWYPVMEEEDLKSLSDILPPQSRPAWDWYRKLEFWENRAQENVEDLPLPNGFLRHQTNIARFMSTHGTLSGLLLVHEPGTGKTSAALAMIEQLTQESTLYQGVLIITSNEESNVAFKQERAKRLGAGEKLKDERKFLGVRHQEPHKYFYTYATHEMFANAIGGKKDAQPEDRARDLQWMIETYSRYIIVIDEVHSLGEPGTPANPTVYDKYLSWLRGVRDCKVLLLTGTPMENKANEIANILNLLNPPQPMPIADAFDKAFLSEKDRTVRDSQRQALKDRMHAYVSSLRAGLTAADVKKRYVGNLQYDSFCLQPVEMSTEQYEQLKPLFDRGADRKEMAYSKTRQANLMAFPVRKANQIVPTIADEHTQSGLVDMVDHTDKNVNEWKWKPGQDLFAGLTTDEERVTELKKWSAKYAACVESILNHPTQLHFVYCEIVSGGGINFFAFLLSKFSSSSIRARLITGSEGDTNKIIQGFNDPSNAQGQSINVLLGSKVLAEAFTLKNVRHVHFLSVWWHYSRIDQVIARALRYQSHDYLVQPPPLGLGMKDVDVAVHFYCALPSELFRQLRADEMETLIEEDASTWAKQSFDFFVYRVCQQKDRSIKSVERLLFEASVDCALNYQRNRVWDDDLNNTRACQYQACSYTCDGIDDMDVKENDLDRSTYDLFYAPIRDQLEQRIQSGRLPFTLADFADEIKQDIRACWIEVSKLIHRGMTVHDKLGFPLFVQLDQDMVYLSRELPTCRPLVLDANRGIELYRELHMKHWLPAIVRERLPDTLPMIAQEDWSLTDYAHYVNVLPEDFQEELIEQAYLYSLRAPSPAALRKTRFCTYVLDTWGKSFLQSTEKGMFSKRLSHQWRLLPTGHDIWQDAPIEEQQKLTEETLKTDLEILHNPSGLRYMGVIDQKRIFKVLDAEMYQMDETALREWVNEQEEKKEKTTGHLTKKIPTGEVCTSCARKKLLLIAGEYDIHISDADMTVKKASKASKASKVSKASKASKPSELTTVIQTNFDGKTRLRDLSIDERNRLYAKLVQVTLYDILEDLFPSAQDMNDLTDEQLTEMYRFLPMQKNNQGRFNPNDLHEAFDEPTFTSFAIDKKRRLLKWSLLDKPAMCPLLEAFFTNPVWSPALREKWPNAPSRLLISNEVVKQDHERVSRIIRDIIAAPEATKAQKAAKAAKAAKAVTKASSSSPTTKDT